MKTIHSLTLVASLVAPLGVITGCRAINGAEGATPAEQRATIQSQQSSTLNELYAARPETREKVKKAVGYGFFSNINVNLLLLSTENGYGVVHDNATGKDTYMKMGGGGVGLGLGAKDYRAVFIFTDAGLMNQFINTGWDFGGQADAAAKAGNDGAATGAGATIAGGLEVYQFTKNGLALQATVQGTKYWRDEKLNN
jgi:lipid-binding SYLF domain-containing protein